MAVAFMILMGCGEAPAVDEPVADQVEVVEDEVIEEILVIQPIADPGDLTSFRDQTSDVLYIEVTGADFGSIWGTDIYTDDSYLAVAAVHAGVLALGETDILEVTLLPGQDSYDGSTRNGITSMDYGEWSGSYTLYVINEDYELAAMVDPGNLTTYRENVGETFLFEVTGDAERMIWGTDIYTDDSYLAAAAVHAGVLEDGETGIVEVTILPGEEAYTGSEQNGITSLDYGSWSGSYWVE